MITNSYITVNLIKSVVEYLNFKEKDHKRL